MCFYDLGFNYPNVEQHRPFVGTGLAREWIRLSLNSRARPAPTKLLVTIMSLNNYS